tara:strand:+ start:127 stop:435 length:309 start_codon:yes stop_codon:yes gene_type:complete
MSHPEVHVVSGLYNILIATFCELFEVLLWQFPFILINNSLLGNVTFGVPLNLAKTVSLLCTTLDGVQDVPFGCENLMSLADKECVIVLGILNCMVNCDRILG